MLAFFGQPIFSSTNHPGAAMGYELFVREQVADQWRAPTDFNQISVADLRSLLTQTLQHPLSVTVLALNLEPSQFVDPHYSDMLIEVQATTDVQLIVELTERFDEALNLDLVIAAARKFHRHGLLVSIDDIGTGANTPKLIMLINEFIYEYKFAIQNFRPFQSMTDIAPIIDFWHDMKNIHHKTFAIEGIETAEELTFIKNRYSFDIIQGYYTGRPELLHNSIVDRNIQTSSSADMPAPCHH